MDQEKKENYLRAGEVIQKARKKARELAEPGTNIKVIADEVEQLIREEGLDPAFPVNISIDDAAAHYTPGVKESQELRPDDVVKIDIGAQSDGYIADTALTVNPSGKRQEMIDTVEKVLEEALEFIEPGKTVGEVGTFIENRVPDEYEIVRNLTGHYVDQYEQHAGISIPNVENSSDHVLKEGDAFAIEPFLTDGSGRIKNGAAGNIYKIERDTNVRGSVERELMNEIKEFDGLPFTTRWLEDFGARKRMAMKKLVDGGIVHSYPVLNEVNGGTVVQAEHTVILTEDGKKITTRR